MNALVKTNSIKTGSHSEDVAIGSGLEREATGCCAWPVAVTSTAVTVAIAVEEILMSLPPALVACHSSFLLGHGQFQWSYGHHVQEQYDVDGCNKYS